MRIVARMLARQIAGVYVVSAVFFLGSVGILADEPIETKRKELEAIQARIKATEETLGDLEVQKNSVLTQLRDNERLYGNLSKTLKNLQREIKEKESQLAEIRLRRDDEIRSIQMQKVAMVNQIRAAHAIGKQERLRLLLNQEDPIKAGRLLIYHDYYNRARLSQVEAFQTTLNGLDVAKRELLAGTKSLNRLRHTKEGERVALVQAREARESLLSKLDAEYSERSGELERLQDDERGLQRLISSIQQVMEEVELESGPEVSSKPFHRKRGRLNWPVRGNLVKRFGSSRVSGRWEGVLIKAKEGAQVRTVSGGHVVYADWLRGYGLLMIIDHGSGFMTLYAFNQSLYKQVGDFVEAGEEIAAVGRSGGRSRPGLYFEIRKNGKPVDPIRWCRKVRKGKVG